MEKATVNNLGFHKRSTYYKVLSLSWVKKSAIIEVIASLLIILFVYAALSKLLDYKTFRLQLGRSPYLTAIADLIAWIIPISELLSALSLAFKRTRLIGLYASLFLMILFSGYIYIMLHYSYYLPCSCGGILSNMSWTQHLIFNLFFTIISLIGIVLTIESRKSS
jgi:hypothetical protein